MHEFLNLAILGLVQGVTEFLPISSTAHLILAREWLGMGDTLGLAEDAVLQLATALAVLIYFWRDIWKLDRTTWIALAIGTVPAGIIGFFFQDVIETVFRGALPVAIGLIVGSVVIMLAEFIYRRMEGNKEVSLWRGLVIGLFQILALLPGMSRSGMVISGGLFMGLTRVAAARFGFMLSFPILFAAGALGFLKLIEADALGSIGGPLALGAVIAFGSGMLAIHALITLLKKRSLAPFIVYRLALAAVLLFLVLR